MSIGCGVGGVSSWRVMLIKCSGFAAATQREAVENQTGTIGCGVKSPRARCLGQTPSFTASPVRRSDSQKEASTAKQITHSAPQITNRVARTFTTTCGDAHAL